MWRVGLRLFILLVIILVATASWFAGTESGSRVAVAYISGLVPNFKARYQGGTLVGPLHLRTVVVKTKKVRIEADDLLIDWAPGCLLLAKVCVHDARIGKLVIAYPPLTAPPPPPTWVPTLPSLSAPLDMDVEFLSIGALEITRGEKRTGYTDISAVLAWQNDEIRVDRLVIGMPSWGASLHGTLGTRGDWPLTAHIEFATPRRGPSTFTLRGTGDGSLADTHLQLDSGGLIVARIDGHVAPMRTGMPFDATLDAARFLVPPSGDPAKSALIEHIALTGTGELLGPLTIDGHASIDTPWTPPLAAVVTSAGTWRGLDDVRIIFDDPRFAATVVSDYRWLNGQHFKATVDVRKLDLSMVNPASPSRLAGTLQVDGNIEHGSTVIAINVETLAGTLRQWPVDARGRLRWQDAQWHFDDFLLRQQDNRMQVNGTLGSEWNADATLALGNLHTLQAAFEGNGNGSAHITGEPTDPLLLFTLDTHDLLLPAVTLPAPVAGMDARTARLPAADWRLAGTFSLHDITLDEAYTVDSARAPKPFGASATGTVSWRDLLRWDLDTDFTALSLHSLLPELGGHVDGPFTTRGVLGDTLESLAVDTRLAGTFDAQPLLIDTAFTRTPETFDLKRLHLAHGDNRLNASGRLDPDAGALTLDATAAALERSFPGFTGSGSVTAHVDGPRDALTIDAGVTGNALGYRQAATRIGVDAVEGRLHLVDGGRGTSSLTFASHGLRVGEDVVQAINLAIDGTRGKHRIDVSADASPLAAHLVLTGALRDIAAHDRTPAGYAWDGVLNDGEVTANHWRWSAVGEPALALRNDTLEIAPHCWTDSAARACITAPAVLGRSGHVQGELFHLPVDALLGDLLPIDTVIDGRIGGLVSAAWEDGELTLLDADFRNAEPLQVALAADNAEAQRVIGRVDTLTLRAQADRGSMHANANLVGSDIGAIDAQVDVAPLFGASAGQRLLGGHVRLDGLHLGLVEAFTYQLHDIAGTLDGALTLGGSLASPRLDGNIGVHGGRLGFTRLPVTLIDLDIDGHFAGDRVTFSGGFSTPDSGGRAKIDGDVALNGGDWHGSGTLTGNDLVLSSPPEYQFSVAPDLALSANAERVTLTGDVHVPTGRIELKSLPSQSVSRSRDVIVVRQEQVIREGGLAFNSYVDVNFLLGDDIHFRAFGGEGRLTGSLRVRSRPEIPLLVDGELHVKDGKYTAFGQPLTLRSADVIFNGPPDQPLIDALAVRQIDDASVREVGLRLTGSLRAPQTTLYSTPALPDEQTLVWLTTGRAPAEGPINLRGDAAQAALSLGVAQGSALLSAAGQEIGLQDVQLATTGEGEKAGVQVGTNVSDRIFVGYNRRVFTGDESVLVRLQLTRRLMLEALSGIDSALDIFYTFEF